MTAAWVLLIWLTVDGYPARLEPYSSADSCKMAASIGRAQYEGRGWWICVPREIAITMQPETLKPEAPQ